MCKVHNISFQKTATICESDELVVVQFERCLCEIPRDLQFPFFIHQIKVVKFTNIECGGRFYEQKIFIVSSVCKMHSFRWHSDHFYCTCYHFVYCSIRKQKYMEKWGFNLKSVHQNKTTEL